MKHNKVFILVALTTICMCSYAQAWVFDPADLNRDGVVGLADLSLLQAGLGTSDAATDINKDGTVNRADLALLVRSYGKKETWDLAKQVATGDFEKLFNRQYTSAPLIRPVEYVAVNAALAGNEIVVQLEYLDKKSQYRYLMDYKIGLEDLRIHSSSWDIGPDDVHSQADIRRGSATYAYSGNTTQIHFYSDVWLYQNGGASELLIETMDRTITQYRDTETNELRSEDEYYIFQRLLNGTRVVETEFRDTTHREFDSFGDVISTNATYTSQSFNNGLPSGIIGTSQASDVWTYVRDADGNKLVSTRTYVSGTSSWQTRGTTTTLFSGLGNRLRTHDDQNYIYSGSNPRRSLSTAEYNEIGVRIASEWLHFELITSQDALGEEFSVYHRNNDFEIGESVAIDFNQDGIVSRNDLDQMAQSLANNQPITSLADFDNDGQVANSDLLVFEGFLELITPPTAPIGNAGLAGPAPEALVDLDNFIEVHQEQQIQRNMRGKGPGSNIRLKGCEEGFKSILDKDSCS